jgi:steroid delta-isomerase-like uncharacterized protein
MGAKMASAMGISEELRRKRDEVVREHVELENRHEIEATLGTFGHPRYELIGTGEIFDGPEEVRGYYEETLTAFPDARVEVLSSRHAEDAVIVEAKLFGTQTGPLRGLPPTGRSYEVQGLAIYLFEDDRLVCERIYFDAGTILRQLGVARDPNSTAGQVETFLLHPLRIGGAALRHLFRRRRATPPE